MLTGLQRGVDSCCAVERAPRVFPFRLVAMPAEVEAVERAPLVFPFRLVAMPAEVEAVERAPLVFPFRLVAMPAEVEAVERAPLVFPFRLVAMPAEVEAIGVNMDWEKWGKGRETTFSEFAPTLHARVARANVHFLTHVDI